MDTLDTMDKPCLAWNQRKKYNSIKFPLKENYAAGGLPGGVADTGASPYPTAGAEQAGVGAGPVPLTVGCRPRDPGLAMAVSGTPGERPGPARGAEVCTFT